MFYYRSSSPGFRREEWKESRPRPPDVKVECPTAPFSESSAKVEEPSSSSSSKPSTLLLSNEILKDVEMLKEKTANLHDKLSLPQPSEPTFAASTNDEASSVFHAKTMSVCMIGAAAFIVLTRDKKNEGFQVTLRDIDKA